MVPCTTRRPQGRFLPRAYVCYRASAPIRIDGDLHKKVWLDGPVVLQPGVPLRQGRAIGAASKARGNQRVPTPRRSTAPGAAAVVRQWCASGN